MRAAAAAAFCNILTKIYGPPLTTARQQGQSVYSGRRGGCGSREEEGGASKSPWAAPGLAARRRQLGTTPGRVSQSRILRFDFDLWRPLMLHAARSTLINQRQMQFPRPSPQKAGTGTVESGGGGVGGGGRCPLEVKSQVKIRQDKSEKAGEKGKNYVKI